MRKLTCVVCPLLMLGSAAMAQGKIDTKWHCLKPAQEQKFDVGDMPDHIYGLAQGTCDATSSDSGFAEKSGQFTEFYEGWKTSSTNHGRFNVTMGDGDKVYYTYVGSASTDLAKPASNKWKIVSGTGKYKGIKGSGSCSGKLSADDTGEWSCTGTYTIGK